MNIMNVNEAYCDSPKSLVGAGCSGPLSIKDRLDIQKRDLEGQLKRVNDALDALNANPEVMKVLELVSKV